MKCHVCNSESRCEFTVPVELNGTTDSYNMCSIMCYWEFIGSLVSLGDRKSVIDGDKYDDVKYSFIERNR